MNKLLFKTSKWVSESRSVVSDSLRPHGLYSLWNSPGQNTEVGSPSLLQGIFPTQGSNPGLPHWVDSFPVEKKQTNIKILHPNLQNLVPRALHQVTVQGGSSLLLWICALPQCAAHPPIHTHTFHISFRRFRECRAGQALFGRCVSWRPWAEARPWVLRAAKPQAGPSCWRPAFHPRQRASRNITGQKTNPGDFPGGPVAKTTFPLQGGPGFNPWSGN